MRTDCPKCYTEMELDDWQRSRRGDYRTVWLRCPCCDFAMRDYDMPGEAQPQIGRDANGNELPRTTLHEIYARYDERQAQQRTQTAQKQLQAVAK